VAADVTSLPVNGCIFFVAFYLYSIKLGMLFIPRSAIYTVITLLFVIAGVYISTGNVLGILLV